MSDQNHWAYAHYEKLINAGMTINETRFSDNITRAETFVLLSGLLDVFRNELEESLNPSNIRFKDSESGLYSYIKASPEFLNVRTYDTTGIPTKSVPYKFAINGTFFTTGKGDDGKPLWVPTSPIVVNGQAKWRWASNHTPKPQSAIIIWKDNTVSMQRIKSISEVDLTKVKHLIAGLGIVNKIDPNFSYDFLTEWSSSFADVIRFTNKTCIGYSIKENKIYLIATKPIETDSSIKYDLTDIANELKLDLLLNLDNGGSTFIKSNNEYRLNLTGDNRSLHHIITFEE